VGANWDGQDKTGKFTRNHYWEMGYHDEGKQELAKLRKSMKEGDRIAIKARCGRGSDQIRIKALGIVIGQEGIEDGKVFVDWKVTGLDRLVDSHGVFSTIHGPYDLEDQELILLNRSEIEKALYAGEFKILTWTAVISLSLQYLDSVL